MTNTVSENSQDRDSGIVPLDFSTLPEIPQGKVLPVRFTKIDERTQQATAKPETGFIRHGQSLIEGMSATLFPAKGVENNRLAFRTSPLQAIFRQGSAVHVRTKSGSVYRMEWRDPRNEEELPDNISDLFAEPASPTIDTHSGRYEIHRLLN